MRSKMPEEIPPLHRAASDIHQDGLTPRVASPLLGSHLAIQRQDTFQRVPQIPTNFCQGSALRVDAGDFLHVGHVPLASFFNDGRKLSHHRRILASKRDPLR